MVDTKEMSKQKTLKYAIWESRETFIKNGYTDEESLKTWLGQSLCDLYQTGSASGFSLTSAGAINGDFSYKGYESVSQNDVLDFLVQYYIKKIDSTEEKNIRDDFQTAIKCHIDSEGINIARASLKAYMKRGDLSNYTPKAQEIIEKYNKNSLLQSMGIITVNGVLEEPKPEFRKIKAEENKSEPIKGYYLAVISNPKERNSIDKTIKLMEFIRSGKITNIDKNVPQVSEREVE